MPAGAAVGHLRGVLRLVHGGLLVEQRVEPRAAALRAGQRTHRVDERRQRVPDRDGHDDEQGGDRSADRGRVGEPGRRQGRHRCPQQEERGHEAAAAALPPHRRAQGAVGVREPAGCRGLRSDRLQLGRLSCHEVADPHDLGPRLEQLVARTGLDPPGEQAARRDRQQQPDEHEPDGG